VTSFRLTFNGRQLKDTPKSYLVLPARAGRYKVVAFDAAGNKGEVAFTVVRHNKGFAIAKS
jgi:hypothetical protein